MRTLLLLVTAALLATQLSVAQKLNLNLDALASKAKEKAEVDLDGAALGAAGKAGQIGRKLPVKVGELHVRNYEFSESGLYSDKDLESVRKQLESAAGWNRIIYAKEKNESTEIYVFSKDGEIQGFLIIACEPAEVSLVHIVGSMTDEELKELVTTTIRYPDFPQP